jgi:hypothetical protein
MNVASQPRVELAATWWLAQSPGLRGVLLDAVDVRPYLSCSGGGRIMLAAGGRLLSDGASSIRLNRRARVVASRFAVGCTAAVPRIFADRGWGSRGLASLRLTYSMLLLSATSAPLRRAP